jgi:O-antigen ligase
VVRKLREAVGPLYLFACLILGGSAQGVWTNMFLQLAGIGILAWAAASVSDQPLSRAARQLLVIALLALALVLLQLVPLPSGLWSGLGGRSRIALDYQLLGLPLPALPLSLTPDESVRALLTLIPPLAMLVAMVRLRAYRSAWLAAALVGGPFAGILLGAMQVASTDPTASPWYLYPETSFGFAVGFFANANHMATLLVITLPFLAALLVSARGSDPQRFTAVLTMIAGATLVVAVGVVLNRSLAGYLLVLPVIAASALIVMPPRSQLRQWAMLAAGLFLLGAVGALESSAIRSGSIGEEASSSVESREAILTTTATAIRDFLPLGSGVGSFRKVYRLYENHETVDTVYVNHAHNDYAELILETGLPGAVLLVLFLLCWGAAVWRVWRSPEAGPYARAASIASAAILAHSIVDFPLRTAAIATCFAMSLGLLANRRTSPPRNPGDLRATRHVTIK